MTKIHKTTLNSLRIIAFLEGFSLLFLVFFAMPMKYGFDNPIFSKIIGPIHGTLFMLFLLLTLIVGIQQKWQFTKTTWKVLIACVIPFGTFYIDRNILKPIVKNAMAS